MSDTESSRVEAFLADVSKRPQQRGNLIFALDATASRERTWDTAARLQVQMFREAAVIGSLDVQLVYFRGMNDFGGECKASTWVSDPMVLAKLMAKIRCDAGETQIGKVLTHALREANQRKINAVVFVSETVARKVKISLLDRLSCLPVSVFRFSCSRRAMIKSRECASRRSPKPPTALIIDLIKEAPGSWLSCLKPLLRLLSVVL